MKTNTRGRFAGRGPDAMILSILLVGAATVAFQNCGQMRAGAWEPFATAPAGSPPSANQGNASASDSPARPQTGSAPAPVQPTERARADLFCRPLGSLDGDGFGPFSRASNCEIKPFWQSRRVVGEAALFVLADGATTAQATLLFAPDKIEVVRKSLFTGDEVVYRAGIDYVWRPGSRTLTLPAGSRIPFRTTAQLYSGNGLFPSKTARPITWDESAATYAGAQVEITYEHSADPKQVFAEGSCKLKGAIRALRSRGTKNPFKIAFLGDSITFGGNASGLSYTEFSPRMPPYAGLFARALQAAYDREVRIANFAVSGTMSHQALTGPVASAVEFAPDLVVIAYGMNDATFGRVPSAFYAQNIKNVVSQISVGAAKEPEFLLVAPSVSNPDWALTDAGLFAAYSWDLWLIASHNPKVSVADVTTLWSRVVAAKRYWDLTANGINHPNDFGHRLYAQALLAEFAESCATVD